MADPPADAPDVPRKGDVIAGKYQVEEIIGRGGMGLVVAARHLALGQRVAIKFLLPSAATQPGAAERFLREARAASAIQSEHVARVVDVATTEGGAPYMVMEYLVGTDLRRVLTTQGKLSVEETIDYVLQACEAIAEAHALGIVHRDLKPANVFLTTRLDGSSFVKVLDFGLSTASSGGVSGAHEATLTTTDAVMGSPPYMSPEQIRSLKSVDSRTDIWSIGVIIYRLLAGRRPFPGDTLLSICASIAADTPPPMKTVRADIPHELDEIVSRCLAKEVSERIQTIAELAQALAPFGTAEAQASVNRIIKVTRNVQLVSGPSSVFSRSAPLVPPSHPLEPHESSTAHAGAWSQARVGNKRTSKISVAAIAAIAVIVGGVAAIATGIGRKPVAPTATPATDPAGAEVPGLTAGGAKRTEGAVGVTLGVTAAAASASAPTPSNASQPALQAPPARSAAPTTKAPFRPRNEPNSPSASQPADPLERWR